MNIRNLEKKLKIVTIVRYTLFFLIFISIVLFLFQITNFIVFNYIDVEHFINTISVGYFLWCFIFLILFFIIERADPFKKIKMLNQKALIMLEIINRNLEFQNKNNSIFRKWFLYDLNFLLYQYLIQINNNIKSTIIINNDPNVISNITLVKELIGISSKFDVIIRKESSKLIKFNKLIIDGNKENKLDTEEILSISYTLNSIKESKERFNLGLFLLNLRKNKKIKIMIIIVSIVFLLYAFYSSDADPLAINAAVISNIMFISWVWDDNK